MMENILNIIQTIRIQDLLDMVIISVMISALLIWFKDRASRFVFVGIIFLAIIYVLSRFFGLYLTSVFLQSFFAILLFVLVVIFQEDLRRFFERLALLGRFRRVSPQPAAFTRTSDILAETLSDFSRKRIGALIVIQGKDPLDRHLTGGNDLEGILSQDLLESIFDPHSAGHDGAVLVDNDHVVRFGCHLPLSTNVFEFGNLGLRHTAALGLSERSDAICIVVSEERGTISIAKGEHLRELANVSALRIELESFFEKHRPLKRKNFFSRWLRENQREKIIAVALACILWAVFGYQREIIRREFSVPLEYHNVPEEVCMVEPKITKANVMLMGHAQAFLFLDSDNLKIIVDLKKLQAEKQEIYLTGKMVKNTASLSVASINPDRITVATSRLVPLNPRIEVLTENKPPAGIEVESISVVPGEARILVPKHLSRKRIRIMTKPIDLSQLDVQRAFSPSLKYPNDIRFVGGKPPAVRVVFKTKMKAAETKK
jgi:diadenylate cyclase